MKRGEFKFTLVEMHAIKHALQRRVNLKIINLKVMENKGLTHLEEYSRNKKDILHEIEIISELEDKIIELKEDKLSV